MTTDHDLEILIAARLVLRRIREQAGHTYNGGPGHTYNGGRVAEAADQAEAAVFQAVNALNTWGGREMTYRQIHARNDDADVSDAVPDLTEPSAI